MICQNLSAGIGAVVIGLLQDFAWAASSGDILQAIHHDGPYQPPLVITRSMAKPGRDVSGRSHGARFETKGAKWSQRPQIDTPTVLGSDGEVNVRFAAVSGPTRQLQALLSWART